MGLIISGIQSAFRLFFIWFLFCFSLFSMVDQMQHGAHEKNDFCHYVSQKQQCLISEFIVCAAYLFIWLCSSNHAVIKVQTYVISEGLVWIKNVDFGQGPVCSGMQ